MVALPVAFVRSRRNLTHVSEKNHSETSPAVPHREQVPERRIPARVTWDHYFQALKARDRWWRHETRNRPSQFSVLRPGHSWVGLIANLHDLVRKEWSDFSESDQRHLLGLAQEGEEHWMLLGHMRDRARGVVFDERSTRERIENCVKRVIDAADWEFPRVAMESYVEMRLVDNVGPGVATRLLAVARPDRIVSLNDGCAAGLAEFARLAPTTLTQKPENYEKLLRFIYAQPWFRASEPVCGSEREREAWSMRVALLDCFVYRG